MIQKRGPLSAPFFASIKAPLIYSEAAGKITFDCRDFKVGSMQNRGGDLKINGGELTVASRFCSAVGRISIGPSEDSYIDFQSGSRGQLNLNEATEQDYIAWVNAGRIRLNGKRTTPDQFRFVNLAPQDIYILAKS